MNGKIVVMTGATSGIGEAAAGQLAAMGARLVLVVRDSARGARTLQRLRQIAPTVEHTVHQADLSALAEVRDVARRIAAAEPRIDVLVNNAGAIFNSFQRTVDGLERTFALNHMAYFGLSLGLLGRLRASAPSRIVNTASDAHGSAQLDFADLQSERCYARRDLGEQLRYGGPGYQVYARSKLCNLLFTRALAARVSGSGITVNALHPGFVATRFAAGAGGLIEFGMRIAKRFARTPAQGADTLVHLASACELVGTSGLYFHDRVAVAASAAAGDDAAAERLWQESLRLWTKDAVTAAGA